MRLIKGFHVGAIFGNLSIVRKSLKRYHYWCRCACGNTTEVYRSNLKCGKSTSCGCRLSGTKSKVVQTKHIGGATRHPLYQTWRGILNRCYNKKQPHYARYGGRGIRVCKRWLTFEHFIDDIGPRPSIAHTVDRIDNDGNYSSGNCRWLTYTEQAKNKRVSVNARLVTHRGVTKTVTAWARSLGTASPTLNYRLNVLKWSVKKTLETPIGNSGPKSNYKLVWRRKKEGMI